MVIRFGKPDENPESEEKREETGLVLFGLLSLWFFPF